MCIKFCAQDIFFFCIIYFKIYSSLHFCRERKKRKKERLRLRLRLRQRERKKDRDRDWDTQRDRDRDRDRQTDRQTDRQRQRDTDKQRDRQRDRENKITEDQCSNSNINEVIKTVLNSVFFFVTKRFPMHKKHQKTQKHNQAKAQNTNKWTK